LDGGGADGYWRLGSAWLGCLYYQSGDKPQRRNNLEEPLALGAQLLQVLYALLFGHQRLALLLDRIVDEAQLAILKAQGDALESRLAVLAADAGGDHLTPTQDDFASPCGLRHAQPTAAAQPGQQLGDSRKLHKA
jgi:hypothetical protein